MYKPIYDKTSGGKRAAELFTWLLLLFLLPTTALGYVAEGSIPGQPLYPIKLGIEHTALILQFLSPQAQASYQVGLVNKRFDEVQTLLTKDTSSGEDFSNFGLQLQDATRYINSLPDSSEKIQLKEKLLTNIQAYQQQLKDQQQIIENKQQIEHMQTLENYQNPSVHNQQQYVPPPPPHYTNTFSSPSQTPTPTQSNSTPDNSSSVVTALNTIQYQLDQTSNDLTQNTIQNVPPSPTSTPSETPAAFSTSTPIPTQIPTLTPTQQSNYNPALCDQQGYRCVTDKTYCNGIVHWNYSFPYSCSSQYPFCCPRFATPTPTPYHQDTNYHN